MVSIWAGLTLHSKPKPFCFISAWLGHDGFEELVRNSWASSCSWEENISSFIAATKLWNRDISGHIQKRKDRLLRRLHGLHRSLLDGCNPFLEDLQKKFVVGI